MMLHCECINEYNSDDNALFCFRCRAKWENGQRLCGAVSITGYPCQLLMHQARNEFVQQNLPSLSLSCCPELADQFVPLLIRYVIRPYSIRDDKAHRKSRGDADAQHDHISRYLAWLSPRHVTPPVVYM